MSNRPRQKASATNKKPKVFTEDSSTRTKKDGQAPKRTTLKATLYLALAIVSLVIGVHRVYLDNQTESISTAIGYNYWIFMITIAFLLLLRYERKKPAA
jgi:hypothetical protein